MRLSVLCTGFGSSSRSTLLPALAVPAERGSAAGVMRPCRGERAVGVGACVGPESPRSACGGGGAGTPHPDPALRPRCRAGRAWGLMTSKKGVRRALPMTWTSGLPALEQIGPILSNPLPLPPPRFSRHARRRSLTPPCYRCQPGDRPQDIVELQAPVMTRAEAAYLPEVIKGFEPRSGTSSPVLGRGEPAARSSIPSAVTTIPSLREAWRPAISAAYTVSTATRTGGSSASPA